jgi:hypothetical protein
MIYQNFCTFALLFPYHFTDQSADWITYFIVNQRGFDIKSYSIEECHHTWKSPNNIESLIKAS